LRLALLVAFFVPALALAGRAGENAERKASAPAVKKHITQVLARQEFQTARSSDLPLVIGEFMRSLVEWAAEIGLLSRLEGLSNRAVDVVFLIGMLVILALAMVFVIRRRRHARSGAGATPSASGDRLLEDPAEHIEAARIRQARGDYIGAFRLYYAAILAHLARRGLVDAERTFTDAEYLAQLRSRTGAEVSVGPVEQAARAFEDVFYACRSCERRDAEELGRLAGEVCNTL